jgi:hypothetical protein
MTRKVVFVTRFCGEDNESVVFDRSVDEVGNAIALCNQSLGTEDWPGEAFLGELKTLERYFNRPVRAKSQCLSN